MKVTRSKRRGNRIMATQLQPTPILKGNDAKAVIRELNRQPSPAELRKMEERKEFFAGIKKRGL